MIELILFDLDDTIYPRSSGVRDHVNRLITAFVSRELGISAAEADSLRHQNTPRYGTTINWLRECHDFGDTESYMEAIHPLDFSPFLPEPAPYRPLFQSLPLRKAILTNAPREHAERVLTHLNLRDCFESLTDIRENSLQGKPALGAYQRALVKADLSPERILFIDDAEPNLTPFRDMGGQVLLIDEATGKSDSGCDALKSIFELPGYLTAKGWLKPCLSSNCR